MECRCLVSAAMTPGGLPMSDVVKRDAPPPSRVSGGRVTVTLVNACLREGGGGSPTAVLDEISLSDDERRGVAVRLGASHAVFVSVGDGGPVSLRFFTGEGELPGCGHGTVAALAYLAARSGRGEFRGDLRVAGRVFSGWAVGEGAVVTAGFEVGEVGLREATADELGLVLPGLGVPADGDRVNLPGSGMATDALADGTRGALAGGARVATLGRSRMLVPVGSRSVLGGLRPDVGRLRDACDRLDLLGCYVHTMPTATGRVAARMFAPSIGVAEDIANANSTACLAAYLSTQGIDDITVDMGDSLGSPATITAGAVPRSSPPRTQVGTRAPLTATAGPRSSPPRAQVGSSAPLTAGPRSSPPRIRVGGTATISGVRELG
jgi:trans-2,3-dihydro-3-hydroxyanthranilate isomerase